MNSTFKKVWCARLISILGTELTSFGVSVWIYSSTGKATPMAITLLCSILPSIILGPFSGVICDRYNRKFVILVADTLAALISLSLFFYIKHFDLHFVIICFFVFCSSVANTFDNNAYQASITTLVSSEELKKANGLNQIINSLSTIISPVVAGILYSVIGLKGIIMVDLISYMVSFFMFIRIDREKFSTPEVMAARERGKTREQMIEGFRFIASQKSLCMLLIYFTLLNFLFNISTSLIEPLSLTVGDSVQLGLIKSCGGIGVLCGSLFVTTYDFKKPFYQVISYGGLLTGIALMFMGSTSAFVCIAGGRLAFSMIIPVISTLAGTVWMKSTPQQLQGRVFATKSMILRCFMPLSYLVVGPLADVIIPGLLRKEHAAWLVTALGPDATAYRFIFVGVGVCVILLTGIMLLSRNFKKLA